MIWDCYAQVNLEFLVIDKRTFLTDKEHALQMLFGEANESQALFNSEIATISDRLATAFASLKVRLCLLSWGVSVSLCSTCKVYFRVVGAEARCPGHICDGRLALTALELWIWVAIS